MGGLRLYAHRQKGEGGKEKPVLFYEKALEKKELSSGSARNLGSGVRKVLEGKEGKISSGGEGKR